MNKEIKRKNSGYTLLFAVLTASLTLGVAAFILGVARKQQLLSSTARDSMYSFYNADSGLECVLKDVGTGTLIGTTTFNLSCGAQTVVVAYPQDPTIVIENGVNYKVWSASTTLGKISAYNDYVAIDGCAVIDISQKYDATGVSLISTTIRSKGYNLCVANGTVYGPDTTSPRTVERGLQMVIQ
jgi:hypothetical protein